jgi:hypothetical protein
VSHIGNVEIRTIKLARERKAFRFKRPRISMVAGAGGTAPPPATASDLVQDEGLILSLYNVSGDGLPTDSVHNEGGALIVNAQLELVFWGSAWQTTTGPSAGDVVNAVNRILASPYLLALAQYGFQSAAVRGSTIVTSPAPPAGYSMGDVGDLVWNLIDDGKFPEPDDDGGHILFMVFMPPGTNPPAGIRGEHGDPSDFDPPIDVDYAWVGFVSYGSLDYITDVFTHELVEAITDPEPHDPAWLMNRSINGGDEIGDACNNTVDHLDGILVQAYWSERQKACVIPQAQGTFSVLHYLEQGRRIESGTTGTAYLSLDKRTPIDASISLTSDNPAVLSVPPTLLIPAGALDASVVLNAQPIVGPPQSVAIHASYRGVTVTALVEVTPGTSKLAGVVTDLDSRPISQAIVVVDNGDFSGAGHSQLTTDANGAFATGVLSPDTYTVEVTASGFVPAQAAFVVAQGVPTTRADFRLVPRLPATVSGTVSDADDAPIVGAQVLLLQQDFNGRMTTVTDSDGGFRLPVDLGFYTGRYWLRVTAPNFAEGFLDLAIANGDDLREDFVLPRLGTLTGSVAEAGVTPPGPISGATLRAETPTDDPLIHPTVTVTSDAGGRYQLQLPPGQATLTVRASGHETFTTAVTVLAGEAVNQDVALVQASATLTGTVFDSHTGETVDGPHVNAGGRESERTDPDGVYTVTRIASGSQEVFVNARGYKPQHTTRVFTAHQTLTVDFSLDPEHPDPDPPGHHHPT